MKYIIAKFGGWANASAERVKLAADLFQDNKNRRIKINSAIGKVEGLPKVTDLLTQGVEIALLNGEFPKDIFEKIKQNHYAVFEPLGIVRKKIDEIMDILYGYIQKKDEVSADHYRALIIGSGEELFSRLDAYYINDIRGIRARYVDPREIGHFLVGHPLDGKVTDITYKNLNKLRDIEEVVVYPGFFGVSKSGLSMIYSRGGSDKTAADLAVACKADIYENWKDVEGIYCADPRIVDNPMMMDEVTYKEIRELSYVSFNVLHQEAMLPVKNADIPINLKNLLKPDSVGTMIVGSRKINKKYPVAGIAHIEDICFINIEKTLMNEDVGYANKILNIFREHRIAIEQITTGIDSICLIISEKEFKEKNIYVGVSEGIRRAIEPNEFIRWLKEEVDAESISLRRNKALVCIVGEGMRHTVGVAAKITSAMAKNKINVEVIDQGPSERNIIIGIDCEEDKSKAKEAVKVLYNEFFK